MIEKFSDEELKQIKKELGIVDAKPLAKQNVLRKELAELNEVWKDKAFSKHNCIFNIIDIALCNVEMKRRHNRFGNYEEPGVKSIIDESDINEYKQMFQEILEIIKRHNRKWEGENQ